ncbi:MAG: EF-hand domain-containing protein [Rhizomicrobium sp.]|jgi:Ca2+-binding EF-hand superfamily protein
MKYPLRYALLFGAALVVGGGVAIAQMSGSTDLPGASSRTSSDFGASYARGRLAERFLAEFDINKDGKVTHDELNRTLAAQFMVASGNAPTMTEDQFVNGHLKDLRQRVTEIFHRMDWNGDGKLSLEEYAAPEHARFESMDRDGTGVVSCRASSRSNAEDGAPPRASKGSYTNSSGGNRRRSSGSSGRGKGSFCHEADLNNDGQVTRAELDKAVSQEFASASKGGFMTFDQFYALEQARARDIYSHVFDRLNTSRSGKLTLQEYAAPDEKLFARLDKNNDGTVTADEMMSSRSTRYASNTRSGH